MTVTITDDGAKRVVEIAGEQHGYGGVVHHSRIETDYSRATLEAMVQAKGEMWLRDEIARAEAPDYIQAPLRRQFERFGSIEGRRVLDFGCGCGSSTLVLARLGAAQVVGVEPDKEFVAVARLRVRDSGLAERIAVYHVPETTALPFDDGRFDAVVMNAVLEHIPPGTRQSHLREIWRVIAPGGRLLIGETPNRLWPQDYHTTGLWWVPYMPLELARRYAIARGRVPADASLARLLAEGIRGGAYHEIERALGPDAVSLNKVQRDDVTVFWSRSLARAEEAGRSAAFKQTLFAVHWLIDRMLFRPLGFPAVALLPEISVCFEKRGILSGD